MEQEISVYDLLGPHIWVFNGGGTFPSGVFSDLEAAEAWIRAHSLTGVLTAYPLNQGVYDWATQQGHFKPKREHHGTASHVGRFSSASQPHIHYEDGKAH